MSTTQRLVKRHLMQGTVQQLVHAIKGLQGDIARIHYRLVVTERIIKVKLGMEKEEIDGIVETMLKEGEEMRKQIVEKAKAAALEPKIVPQPQLTRV